MKCLTGHAFSDKAKMNLMLHIWRFEYMKVCIFMLLMSAFLFGQNDLKTSVSGTIRNSSGDRVSGVKICKLPWDCVMTNTDGRYEITDNFNGIQALRFTHPRYNSVIKFVSSNEIDVVLKQLTKESDNKRAISYCSENNNLLGGRLKVLMPSNDVIKIGGGDHVMLRWPGYKDKDEQLVVVNAPNASIGFPNNSRSWPLLEESTVTIYDKDIYYENQVDITSNHYIDVKVQLDGRFWRFIGNIYEVITYENVSEETAREFDDILDNTLCIAQ